MNDEMKPPSDQPTIRTDVGLAHRGGEMTITMSSTIGALIGALVATDIPAVEKRSVNKHLGNKYASLDDIVASTRPVLRKAGLAILQTFAPSRGGVTVVTLLAHTSGEWIRGALYLPSPPAKGLSEEQTYGKAATYARRYGYTAMLSIASEEDDDAQIVRDAGSARREPPPAQQRSAPSGNGQQRPPQQPPPRSAPHKSADEYIGEMKLAISIVELRNIAGRVNKDVGLSQTDRQRCSEAFQAEKAKLEKSAEVPR